MTTEHVNAPADSTPEIVYISATIQMINMPNSIVTEDKNKTKTEENYLSSDI
jgi:hypothetical protein